LSLFGDRSLVNEREWKLREVQFTHELLEHYRKKECAGSNEYEKKQIIIKALVDRLIKVNKELDSIEIPTVRQEP